MRSFNFTLLGCYFFFSIYSQLTNQYNKIQQSFNKEVSLWYYSVILPCSAGSLMGLGVKTLLSSLHIVIHLSLGVRVSFF